MPSYFVATFTNVPAATTPVSAKSLPSKPSAEEAAQLRRDAEIDALFEGTTRRQVVFNILDYCGVYFKDPKDMSALITDLLNDAKIGHANLNQALLMWSSVSRPSRETPIFNKEVTGSSVPLTRQGSGQTMYFARKRDGSTGLYQGRLPYSLYLTLSAVPRIDKTVLGVVLDSLAL